MFVKVVFAFGIIKFCYYEILNSQQDVILYYSYFPLFQHHPMALLRVERWGNVARNHFARRMCRRQWNYFTIFREKSTSRAITQSIFAAAKPEFSVLCGSHVRERTNISNRGSATFTGFLIVPLPFWSANKTLVLRRQTEITRVFANIYWMFSLRAEIFMMQGFANRNVDIVIAVFGKTTLSSTFIVDKSVQFNVFLEIDWRHQETRFSC